MNSARESRDRGQVSAAARWIYPIVYLIVVVLAVTVGAELLAATLAQM